MDKFLLLRDNKQTGPYSAAELEKMGLKSYDLIWEEGRSAAWRYPGEVTALKSFAPPVEEQPYDRFYKKEQSSKQPSEPGLPQNHDPSQNLNSGHIFVSVPTKPTESRNEKSFTRVIPSSEILHSPYQPKPIEHIIEPDRLSSTQPQKELTHRSYEKPTSSVQTKEKGIRPVHWMSAALVLFALISVFLFFNYQQQHKQLNRLNEIVLNMQQGQQNPTPVHNAVAPIIQPEPNIIDTLGLTLMNYEAKQEPSPVKPVNKPVPKNIVAKKDTVLKTIPQPETDEPVVTRDNSNPVRIARKRNISEQVRVMTNEDFKVGFLGGISNLQVTLENTSDRPMNKVQVLVEYLSKENKVVKTQELNFNKIEPGASLTKDVPRTARGVTVRCKVGTVDLADSVATNNEHGGKTP